MTQAELGNLIGVDQSTIQRAETLAPSAVLRTYLKCAEALNVGLVDLFADERTPEELRLLRSYRELVAGNKAHALRILRSVLLDEGEEAVATDKTAGPSGRQRPPQTDHQS